MENEEVKGGREDMGILIPKWKCQRCGYEWIPRSEETPRLCPKCHSLRWDKPKENENDKNKEELKNE